MGPRERWIALAAAALALAVAPGAGTAQTCGLAGGPGVRAAAGGAYYAVGDGVMGATIGLDLPVAMREPPAEVALGYRHVALDGPDVGLGRLAVAIPLPAALLTGTDGPSVCATLHAGASRFGGAGQEAYAMAGGLGLRAVRVQGNGDRGWTAWAELRGLGATVTGSLYGVELQGTGVALGGEAGLRFRRGAVELGADLSADGLDDGLGLTPYPVATATLMAGIRF